MTILFQYTGIVKMRQANDHSHYLAKLWMPQDLRDIKIDVDSADCGSEVRFVCFISFHLFSLALSRSFSARQMEQMDQEKTNHPLV